jgi:Cu/Ag efflux protein CusF
MTLTLNQTLARTVALASLSLACGLGMAAGTHGMAQDDHSSAKASINATATALTAGVVKKIDMANKKITLKHEEIKNLEMPGMTMVFQVKDEAVFGNAKVGDKVQFRAEKQAGAIVITQMEAAK